jgi:chemotaxis protein MotB
VRRFETLGIESSRMTVLGLGEHRPAATNDTVEGRNRNRRVVLVVLDQGAMAAVPPGVRPDSDGVAAP